MTWVPCPAESSTSLGVASNVPLWHDLVCPMYHCGMTWCVRCTIVAWPGVSNVPLWHDLVCPMYHCGMTWCVQCAIVAWPGVSDVPLWHGLVCPMYHCGMTWCVRCTIVAWPGVSDVPLWHDLVCPMYHCGMTWCVCQSTRQKTFNMNCHYFSRAVPCRKRPESYCRNGLTTHVLSQQVVLECTEL